MHILSSYFFLSDCPTVISPFTLGSVDCSVKDNCLGFQCCADINLKITEIRLQHQLSVDLCNFVISVGFGEWVLDMSLFSYQWGTEEMRLLGNSITIRYVKFYNPIAGFFFLCLLWIYNASLSAEVHDSEAVDRSEIGCVINISSFI